MHKLRFSELFDFQKKSSRKSGDGLTFGKYPFFTSSSKLSKFTDKPDYKIDNALIFGTGGNASVHYVTDSFSTSTDCFVVTQKGNIQINLKFAYYYLSGNIHLLEEGFKGAGLKHISKAYIQEIQIPLPCITEQQKIVEILDAADSLRQKDQQLVERYTALSQSLFLEMFGDPVTNPMGWEMRNLESVLSRKSQNGLYLPKEKYKADGIEMVHMSDAFYGLVSLEKLKKVSLTSVELKTYQLSENDLLVARRSLTYEGAAKPCRIPQSNKPLVYESSLIRITPNQELVNTLYLYFFFSNDDARNRYINKYISRSTISGINNKGLNSIEILTPPISLQNQFAERIQLIEAQKQQAQCSLEKSEALFNSLLQRAFTGELTAKMAA